jgi:hypothetical protein
VQAPEATLAEPSCEINKGFPSTQIYFWLWQDICFLRKHETAVVGSFAELEMVDS